MYCGTYAGYLKKYSKVIILEIIKTLFFSNTTHGMCDVIVKAYVAYYIHMFSGTSFFVFSYSTKSQRFGIISVSMTFS